MGQIQILSDHLASQIAAGEVVERPAAVVKELLENSIDAGATRVEVELEHGGKRRIVVSDDGRGMDADDALLAFDRHATSKIETFDDLERVGTFGFRGEALASICAVARVELTTAVAPGDGVRVRIEGGRVRSVAPAARPQGTRIEIASLFFNVPARRKFLKAPATELRHCVNVVQGYALARPDLSFTLKHQGRTLLEGLATGEGAEGIRRRIGQIFGPELENSLAEVPETRTPDGGRIWGFVGSPNSSSGRRRFTFVNRRLVKDRSVMATFYRAVREEWRTEDFPALFLFFDLAPEAVDVNVHPQKSEVRFRDLKVLDLAGQALRRGLGRSLGEIDSTMSPLESAPAAPLAWQGLGERMRDAGGREGDGEAAGHLPTAAWPSSGAEGLPFGVSEGGAYPGPARLAEPAYAPIQRGTIPLAGRSGRVRPFRLLGQYKGTMILLEGPDGLYVIDQHVAHERVLFERIRRAMHSESQSTQRYLEPVMLQVSEPERLKLLEAASSLEACGFEIGALSGGTVALLESPSGVSAEQAEKLVMRLASAQETALSPERLREELLEGLAADASCKAAVKMHEPLSAPELEALVTELFEAEQPYACPHGRPIVLRMTDSELERRFKRR